ncbi:hypothetical protein RclHR1_00260033 [Rhizophagus clarus]|uniref:Uncharacterized protein n=1 Tax=Rhizophagus clarus TaxID=94130 RepID=A0A2Z6RUR6_9GLOM|nr:hypothetical protein RclHR1_00260033 [Rhizophagus clarus]
MNVNNDCNHNNDSKEEISDDSDNGKYNGYSGPVYSLALRLRAGSLDTPADFFEPFALRPDRFEELPSPSVAFFDSRVESCSVKDKTRKSDVIINYTDIIETIYNSLTSLSNTNEFYEEKNTELSISFNIELSTLINVILKNNISKNIENIDCKIGHYIVFLISEVMLTYVQY